MAQASGLEKVPKDKRNPLNTTTHGTGDLVMVNTITLNHLHNLFFVKDAYKQGARKFIVGVGGSATNDGINMKN